MKKFRLLLVVVVLLGFASSIMQPTQVVQAGGNGQQLEIKNIMARGAKVTVTGRNQNGHTVTWTGWTPGSPSQISGPQGETVATNGWWWVGNVTIRVYWPSSTNQAYSCYKYVTPSQWWSNWVTAKVGMRNSPSSQCG